ncbi:hypothetical protein BGW36DRAFT_384618 [Talaromyces proteolyticus]|uniref:Rhodopsin domain-containing protein n=1 Tax=Talaromyces proteolyticus TaxID=1131652 RepID=A0AAD4KQE4_9EURO|nr:uncharacterized protein BGW36DRAFT_384618 [Talaromyces proteolyticus]KAH8694263.1 hypothetical protein BGW36DRAFT_384618 [Talaromyces proteolyticus]
MRAVSTATVIAVEWTVLGFCLALILARLYLQLLLQRKRLFLSDYFICLAWLSGIWGAALDIELKKLGWLNPSTTWLKFESIANRRHLTQKLLFISWFPLLTTLYLNKMALLSLFFHLFPSVFRTIYYSLWIVTIYSGLSYFASILFVSLACLLSKTQEPNFPFCNAHSYFTFWVATWVLHFSSDVFVFVLPFLILRNLRLNWKKRIGLCITFGFGLLSITACLLRFLIVLLTYPNVSATTTELLCAIDSYVGIVVACLPSLRPYLNLKHVTSQHPRPSADSRKWHFLGTS